MGWTATLSSKGQLTLPKAVREALGVEAGDTLLVTVQEGKVELVPLSGDILSWYGTAQGKEPPPDWRRVRQQVHETIAEEVVREMHDD